VNPLPDSHLVDDGDGGSTPSGSRRSTDAVDVGRQKRRDVVRHDVVDGAVGKDVVCSG
jgi:hypothetical protein